MGPGRPRFSQRPTPHRMVQAVTERAPAGSDATAAPDATAPEAADNEVKTAAALLESSLGLGDATDNIDVTIAASRVFAALLAIAHR